MYYELTDETRQHGSATLHRIRATRDLPRHGVRAGDLGGWVEKVENLSGDAWVSGDARVFGDAWVSGDAWVFGNARVFGDAWVSGDARVSGGARVFGDAWVCQPRHLLTISPFGSEDITVTLYRTSYAHTLRVGCWTGTVDTLHEEVTRRARDWDSDLPADALHAEYAALEEMCRARVNSW